jgi:diguanylate cyclase (GGDEF)-like protein/PAS domain S-box-containing protein
MSPPGSISALPGLNARARALACLFLGGGAICLFTIVVIPPPRAVSLPGVLTPALAALVIGAVLYRSAARVRASTIPVVLALGTLLISVGLYFGSDVRSGGEVIYLWVGVYSFFTLSRAVAIAEVGIVGLCYAVVLVLRSEPYAGPRWTIMVGTLIVAGLFAARIVARIESLFRHARRREAELRTAEARFRSAFDDAAIGMAIVGLDGRWTRVNEALARITGYEPSVMVGMSFRDLTPATDVADDEGALARLVSGQLSTYHAEKRYIRADGEIVWVSLNVSVVKDASGRPQHLISQIQDVSGRKAAEHELSELALHDPLTGLPNRRLFTDRVEQAIAGTQQGGRMAVLFVDLDRFKLVNDSLGHAVGDRLLAAVATRLRAVVRPTDTISRFGGDEFTLLCEDTDEAAAARVAERILKSLARPFPISEHELFVSASIGISVCRDAHTAAGAMLRDADAAMYRAKDEGRTGYAIFDGGMRSRATARLELENDLRRALDQHEFELAYQPDVDLQSGRMTGVEALLRWHHPRRGTLLPGQFIETAEESGMIVPLGEWVLDAACRQARIWQDAGHPLSVSVNISPLQLSDPKLPDVLAATLASTGADPYLLTLEITESAAVHADYSTLKAIRDQGVRLAFDDFGSGFSSLSQIRSLPEVDTLKIDRLFTEELGRRPADTAIVAAIVRMANAMGMDTVAEGIETELQARIVKRLGCERGQGYHFGRPMPAEALTELLSTAPIALLSSVDPS